MLHPVLLLDVQRLSVIKSDLETTLLMFVKNANSPTIVNQVLDELNGFKNDIATMGTGLSEQTRNIN